MQMKSIKPGRGPSKLSAVGSILAAVFGVFWCIVAGSMGAWFMIPFGLIFIVFAIYQAVYHHHNATSEDRYSVIDIVDSEEESDPLNEKYGRQEKPAQTVGPEGIPGTSVAYCPYCDKPVEGDFDFCPKCGKKLPD